MANNGLKTFNDIMDYLSYLDKKYGEIEKELKETKIGIFSSDKKKLKAKKTKMEEELERISNIYDQYDRFFKDSTTFGRNDLASFLAKYFTLYYGKTYEVQYDVRDTSESKYAKSCDFIASVADFARIDEKYNLEAPVNLDDVLNLCKDNCISLGGSKTHTLLADSELNSEFSSFPEIIEVAKRLINIKLANPNLTDKQRLEIAIKDIATENELKRQESELATHVKEETEPKINILNRNVQASTVVDEAPAPKINIINRTDVSSQTVTSSSIIGSQPQTSSTSSFDARNVKPTIVIDEDTTIVSEPSSKTFIPYNRQMQSQHSQIVPEMKSSFTEDQQPDPVVIKETPETSGGRKLSKSMMGMYMNRR